VDSNADALKQGYSDARASPFFDNQISEIRSLRGRGARAIRLRAGQIVVCWRQELAGLHKPLYSLD
jgi:hypothetical protein